MIKNVKIQVTPEQTVKIQKVVFDNDGRWDNKTKTINWLIITAGGDISWATTDTAKCYSEFDAEEWLKDALGGFPIYKMHKSQNFIVRFDYNCEGEVVWVKSNSDTEWSVGDIKNDWVSMYDSAWKNVDNINLFVQTVENNIEEHVDELEYEETVKEWLTTNQYRFPIYKMQQDGKFIVGFDGETSGEVVWVKSNSDTQWNVGHYSENWIKFTDSAWQDVDINLYLFAPATPSKYNNSVKTEKEITQGAIVQATRKGSTSDKDYTWQGVYFGYCNGKHLIDANTTHVMLADEVQIIPTLTKKEAKQKISELFANPKNVTSEKVRNIIDLIKN